MNIFIILPTQLFKNIKILKKYDLIYLIEEPYYLNPNYHKQKLLLHISSLNYYKDYLIKNDINVKYLHFNQINYNSIFNNNNNYKMYNPIDKQMIKLFNKYNVEYLDSPMFLNTYEDLLNYKNSKNKNNYNQSDFYKNQRIKYNILIDKNNKPLYNKWSFDTENRQKFPKNYIENKIAQYNNKYLEYATKYINENFPNSFGIINNYYYPCTHNNAIKHLKHFMNNKIKYFGNFQDAISDNVIYGYHSNISALLNIGLLTPKEVIDLIIKYFNSSNNKKEIINSIEGIIRQIIGWREYMHFIYTFYSTDIININYINLNNTLPNSWYTGKTELSLLNNIILKVQNYAYLHHIERLMIINNLMYLYQIKFKDIYKWFMTCFIDSYDWVMIPNILMNVNSLDSNIKYMTRVYISSDNYLKKMSNYNNKNDFKIINKLYWDFIKKNKNVLKKDYGLASQVKKILNI
jgi:deoxyribodipyrimidine photolyase-related protein